MLIMIVMPRDRVDFENSKFSFETGCWPLTGGSDGVIRSVILGSNSIYSSIVWGIIQAMDRQLRDLISWWYLPVGQEKSPSITVEQMNGNGDQVISFPRCSTSGFPEQKTFSCVMPPHAISLKGP
jgi:hypothetical protein